MISSASDAADHGWPDRYSMAPDERASVSVVEAVGAAANTTVKQLPILYDVIDPDALDALFAPRPDGTVGFGGRVTFTYAGYRVTIGDRTVTLRPAPE